MRLSPGKLMEMVTAAVDDGPPLGVSIDDLARITERSDSAVKMTLQRLLKDGRLFKVNLANFARYFPTQERADAARPQLEVDHHAMWVQRSADAKAARLAREGAQPARDWQASPSARVLVLAHLMQMDPKPVSIEDLVTATGCTYGAVKSAMHRLIKDGQAWAIAWHGFSRYFAKEAARDAALKWLTKPAPRVKGTERGQAFSIVRREHDGPAKKEKAPVHIDWSQAKRTECTPCQVDRFRVEGPVIGGFGTMGIGRYLPAEPPHGAGGEA